MNTLEKLKKNGINLNYDDVIRLCKKYNIKELSVFGSSLRDDFKGSSDVDFLVSYYEMDILAISLFDVVKFKNELSQLLDRDIDIVEKDAIENPIRRKNILSTAEVIYAYQ